MSTSEVTEQFKVCRTELTTKIESSVLAVKNTLQTKIERCSEQIDQLNYFTYTKCDDQQKLIQAQNDKIIRLASKDHIAQLEITFKQQMSKYEVEVDDFQAVMRDLNNKFNDCQNRLLKQLELNALKGSQLQSQIDGGPSPLIQEMKETMQELTRGFRKQQDTIETIS